jgi:DNA-binding transcriptional LysR family regulator
VPGIVARFVLPDIASRFLTKYPGIRLEVSANDRFIDVLAAGFDAGIRYDEALERDMIRLPIGPRRQRFVLAAAPAYLAKHGAPTHPRDIIQHAAIRHRFDSGAMPQWEFERGPEVVKVNPDGPLVASSPDMEVAAAVHGHGLIYGFEEFLGPALASGALTPLLPDWWANFSGPFLYYQSRNHMPAPLRAFVDFVKGGAGL